MLTTQVKDLRLRQEGVSFKEVSVTRYSQKEEEEEEEEAKPYRKKVKGKQLDQLTVKDAFKMPNPLSLEQQKRETKRVLHE